MIRRSVRTLLLDVKEKKVTNRNVEKCIENVPRR